MYMKAYRRHIKEKTQNLPVRKQIISKKDLIMKIIKEETTEQKI